MGDERLDTTAPRSVRAVPAVAGLGARLPVILGDVAEGITIQDHSGRVLFANAAAARASGYATPDEMIAAPAGDFLKRVELLDEHGEPFPLEALPGTRALAGEPGTEVTLRVRHRASGEVRWTTVRALPLLDRRGAVEVVINLLKDVTEQKLAEARLRESEQRFRLLADTAPVMIWTAGTDARSEFFNQPWLDFTGRALDEELGDGWVESVHPEDRERCLRTYREAFDAREDFRMEYRLRRADGEYRWVLDTGTPRFTMDREFIGFVGSVIDITARKRIEDGQSFLLEASALLGESLDYGDRLVTLANAVVPRIADWCAVDIIQEDGTVERLAVAHQDPAKRQWARELQRRYPPDPEARQGIPQVLRSGTAEMYADIPDELIDSVARDEEHAALLRQVGFRSAILVPLATRGRVLGALTLVTAESGRRYDESDRILAEELARRAANAIDNARLFREVEQARQQIELQAIELEEVAAELETANEELIARTNEAESANRAKSEFLAMMSHELRTPLNAIAGYVELLDMEIHGPLTEQQHSDLQKIQLSQRRLLAIINDVLNFAKLEAGRLDFALVDVPLDEALALVAALFEPQLRAKEMELARRTAEGGVSARADVEKLQQILINLLSNAVKFTAPGGHIDIDWEARGGEIEIRVRDTGRGIPATHLQTIFEPFYQVDAGLTRDVSGVGLGLAISRDLARAMGGDLRAESTLGGGSTFFLTLPRGGQAG